MTVNLLPLLQFASPALPVGAYSYSEGLETLIDQQIITDAATLQDWLKTELHSGSIRLETALMVRGYQAILQQDFPSFIYWNQWLSASRETQELRQQSWQMGQSLLNLWRDLDPQLSPILAPISPPCNYALAMAIGFSHWGIDLRDGILSYLFSWMSNLVSAGVRLIPLGQTAGQQTLLILNLDVITITDEILCLKDKDLNSCSWGLSLASMTHETQYTRLFRS